MLSEELAIFSWRNKPLGEKPHVSLNFGHLLLTNLVPPRHQNFHLFIFTSKCFHSRFFRMGGLSPERTNVISKPIAGVV